MQVVASIATIANLGLKMKHYNFKSIARLITMLFAMLALLIAGMNSAFAKQLNPGTYYVKENMLEEKLAPSKAASATNKIYYRQKVEVFETKGEWARVSKYYEGFIEGKKGMVARWVLVSGLSPTLPKELAQPKLASDPRIDKHAISKVGEGGLTAKDVEILHKGALKFLNSGVCKRVELADKSVSKPNTYYVNCGGPNIFFTPDDL